MKRLFLILILSFILIQSPSMAVNLESGQLELAIQSLRNSGSGLMNSDTDDDRPEDDFEFGFEDAESIYEYDYKSPKRAFIYSLLIPGWGQKYAGSHAIKPLFFLVAEAGLWMGYFKFHNDGNKKTDEFQNFANKHWTEGDTSVAQSYTRWLLEEYGVIDDEEAEDLTHKLPDYRDQQYYEMIGKYDQFRAGWDDYWGNRILYDSTDDSDNILFESPNRKKYELMRKDANDLLGRANKFVIFTVVNHLISAFDGALAARRHNRNEAADMWLSVRAEMKKYSATEEIPILRLSCRF